MATHHRVTRGKLKLYASGEDIFRRQIDLLSAICEDMDSVPRHNNLLHAIKSAKLHLEYALDCLDRPVRRLPEELHG